MKKDRSPKIKNKNKILSSLLDSPKTTGELAEELGYVKSNGDRKYHSIDRLLKDLEENGYLVSKKEKIENQSGAPPRRYSINYSFENLVNILNEDPGLISKMQTNDSVLESILKITRTRSYKHRISFENTGRVETYIEKDKPLSEKLERELKAELKEKFRLSPEFFRYFLNNCDSNLRNRLIELAEFNEKIEGNGYKKEKERFVNNWKAHNNTCSEMNAPGFDTAFKVCVFRDILNGQSSEEAKEYLIKIEQEKKEAEEYIKKLKG